MRFDRPILSFKHATAFLEALNGSGLVHLLGLVPKPATRPTGAKLTYKEWEDLFKRISELENLNWKPHGFDSWTSYFKSQQASKP